MKQSFKQRPISSLAALLVFVLFALCILCVLLSGAGVYRRLVTRGQESYAQRTCAQYIATKVRQCEGEDHLSVEPFEDTQALVLEEELEGETYLTRVYFHDGWLMELFSARNGEFAPEDGEKLLPARGLSFGLEDDLLNVTVIDEYGAESRLAFALRGGEGDGP